MWALKHDHAIMAVASHFVWGAPRCVEPLSWHAVSRSQPVLHLRHLMHPLAEAYWLGNGCHLDALASPYGGLVTTMLLYLAVLRAVPCASVLTQDNRIATTDLYHNGSAFAPHSLLHRAYNYIVLQSNALNCAPTCPVAGLHRQLRSQKCAAHATLALALPSAGPDPLSLCPRRSSSAS